MGYYIKYDSSSDVSDDSEQVQVYVTDSDISEHLSDDEDVLTFFRGIQTSSGMSCPATDVNSLLCDLRNSYVITL